MDPEISKWLNSFKESFVNQLKQLEDSQKTVEQDINKSLEFCIEKSDENTKLITAQNEQIKKQQELIESLVTENSILKKQVNQLKYDLDCAQQDSRLNSVKIHGLPVEPNQPLLPSIINLSKSIDFPLQEDMLDTYFQLKNKINDRPGTVVLKFLRRSDKNTFLQKKKIRRDLNTTHLGLQTSSPIYINESLTAERRILLSKARKFKKDFNWKYVWTSAGKIFLRKTDNSKVIMITSQADIDKILS
ncbi:hypothetical protein RN001_015702 [Aquatica leii]|uniref:FP protein C-terminal domain-containing protein n=1 Tax=Aquatica leii TaxID=1421715 RepID=A0AAN7QAS2_9COLE|nr:hypothetical protein RN001_015702 [Aquatica leii]